MTDFMILFSLEISSMFEKNSKLYLKYSGGNEIKWEKWNSLQVLIFKELSSEIKILKALWILSIYTTIFAGSTEKMDGYGYFQAFQNTYFLFRERSLQPSKDDT